MDHGWRLVRCVLGVGGSTLRRRPQGVLLVAMVVRGHDRQRLRPIFVVEALCKAGAGIKGRCRGPRSSPSCSGGDVVEGARASVPLAADLSSESPLTRTL
jgi:hypothetical protein